MLFFARLLTDRRPYDHYCKPGTKIAFEVSKIDRLKPLLVIWNRTCELSGLPLL